MTWLLMVSWVAVQGGGSITQDFPTRAACHAAAQHHLNILRAGFSTRLYGTAWDCINQQTGSTD